MNIEFEPIRLLSGSHADTGTTGHGCFMNVVAYLNGDDVITDKSPCVCVTVRPIVIGFNDWMKDDERHLLLPYILRAMGSATTDKSELVRRANLCATFALKCFSYCYSAARNASASFRSANATATAIDASEVAYRAAGAADNANSASEEASYLADGAWADIRIKLTLQLLDDMLPPQTNIQAIHVERITRLKSLAGGIQ